MTLRPPRKKIRGVRYLILTILALMLGRGAADALRPDWRVDFGSVFDNREGDDHVYDDKTYFFLSLGAEGGLSFTPRDRIAAGAMWIQPLENGVRDSRVVPVAYYRHEDPRWKFSMGLVPRTQLRRQLPGFLWSDSLAYFQRIIRGALVTYDHRCGFAEAYIDWRAHQSETRREAFNILAYGEWRPRAGRLLLGGHALMNHYAKTRNAPEDQSIVDNFLINPYIGADFSRLTGLDSLSVRGGMLMTLERYRGAGPGWRTPAGAWLEAAARWRWIEVRNSLYAGGRLLPLYDTFGASLYQGEAYYKTSFYDRADLLLHIYSNKFMNLRGELNFNFSPSNFMFYQRLMVEISLSGGKR